MKRSGDVTAAAIVLFFGSGLMVLMAVGMIVEAAVTSLPPEQRAVEFLVPIFYAIVAAWGIATGVRVLQLSPWARISMIVMSGLAIFFSVSGAVGLMAVPMVLQQEPNMPAGAIRIVLFVGLIVLAVPLAIAIWWLVLFTRARVRIEFATRGAAAVSSANMGAASAAQFVPAVVTTPNTQEIPVSVRVIAIIFLVFSGFALLGLPFTIRTKIPTVMLGILIQGRTAWAYGLVFVLVQIGLCIAVLKRRAWALDGLIAVTLLGVVNSVLFAISPSRKVFFDTIMQREEFPPGVDASLITSFVNSILPISIGIAVLLWAVVLYFLFTRRKAFRAACEAGQ
jgi:hypothetical protein